MALFRKIRFKSNAGDNIIRAFPNGIKVWYDPADAEVDIVFIHGLTGDRERTWTHDAAAQAWPKVILPGHLPTVRILTFGYDAYVVRRGKAVTNQLIDHSRDFLNVLASHRQSPQTASRALIFVAHSLGGLVCKDAILQSRHDPGPHLRAISETTVAIAFLGTPHGGSDVASWAKFPAKALGIVKSTNTNLLSVLQTSSEVLYRIQRDFLSMLRSLAVEGQSLRMTCFWESQPMPFAGTIVERTSATLPGYNAISIHANHRDMVRFHTAEDAGFVSLLGELRTWLRDIRPSELVSAFGPRARQTRERRLGQMKLRCLKSLTIDELSPHPWEWVFHDRRYQSWNTLGGHGESSSLLWIKGKPGCGKSTLMKRIAHQQELESLTDGTVCLSFSFSACGGKLAKYAVDLYRTLLFQLVQQSKATMAQFLPRFIEKEVRYPNEKVTWQLTEISKFFHSAISELLASPLYIFIDAMDECNEYEVRDVIKDFEKSLLAAVSKGATVKICLSSRHYPFVRLGLIPSQDIVVDVHNP